MSPYPCYQIFKRQQPTVRLQTTLEVFFSHLIFFDNTFVFHVSLLISWFMSLGTLVFSSNDTNLGAAMHTTTWPRRVV